MTKELILSKLETDLKNSENLCQELNKSIAAKQREFDNGEFNSRAAFSEVREILDKIHWLTKELRKETKNAAKIRQEIATFKESKND